MDGSNPAHHGSHQGDDHNLECSVTVKTLGQVDAGIPVKPIVLDDMDSTVVSEMKNAHEGSYRPCMEDAHKGQFHHDWARNKGSASFTYKFMPQADGCYVIEEHHPGSSMACSQYLPRNARLDLDYCRGKKDTLYINQAENGAQWNKIGEYMFYEGVEGRLTMRNAPEEKCATQGNCFWIADAFRLTWKSQKCGDNMQKTAGMTRTAAGMTRTVDSNQQPPAKKEGSLLLRLKMAGGTGSLSVETSRLAVIKSKAIIETSLASYYGYKYISISDIRISGRRLSGHGAVSMKISFTAREKVDEGRGSDLKAMLQKDFNRISSGITVEQVAVEWVKALRPADVQQTSDTPKFLALGVVGLLVVLTGFVIARCLWRKGRKPTEMIVEESAKTESGLTDMKIMNTQDVVVGVPLDKKAEDEDVSDNASTGTPASMPSTIEDVEVISLKAGGQEDDDAKDLVCI